MKSFTEYDDKALCLLLKQGDRNAFTEIYNRYWDKLYYLAYSHLSTESVCEEVVQDVFYTLWKKKDSLNIESLHFYLSAMTRHAVYKKLAKEKKKITAETNATFAQAQFLNEESNLDNKDLLDIVQRLASELPEKCRLVFIHNKLLDKSINEVAAFLNISTKTAEAHLTKALKIVRERLKGVT